MMKSCKLPLEPRSRRSRVGWSEVVAAAALLGWLMLPLETPLGHIEGSIRQSTTTPALHPDKHLPAPPILTIISSSPVMREVEVIVMMGMRVCQSCETSG